MNERHVDNHEAMASGLQTEAADLDIELMKMRQRLRDIARAHGDFCREGSNHLYAAVDALVSAWDYLDSAYISAINEQLHADDDDDADERASLAEAGAVVSTSFGDI